MEDFKNIYFLGIGGIGMSNLARYFNFNHKNVFGYDKTQTTLTNELISEGIQVSFRDETSSLPKEIDRKNTIIVFTPAIPKNSVLKKHFVENDFTIYKRSEVLGLITKETKCLAVAGTHGKTTTSTLLAHLCKEVEMSFSAFLGGISENFKSNFFYSGKEYSIVEADEYDRSFLNLSPDWAIITSTDADHLDIYGDENKIQETFETFSNLVKKPTQLLVKKGLDIGRKPKTYAVNEKADFYSDNLRVIGDKFFFDFHFEDKIIEDFEWEMPGIHNVENATAALALMHQLGFDFKSLKCALAKFKGIKRRYTKYSLSKEKIYIDDYVHHPTEIDAVISSVRNFNPGKKLLVVFQPHLFSRTRDFADDFAKSLSKADELILLDIYPARELPIEGITSDWLLGKVELFGKEKCSLEQAISKIKEKDFDVLLTLGAGNIDTLCKPIVEYFS